MSLQKVTARNEAQTVEDDCFLLMLPLVELNAKITLYALCFVQFRLVDRMMERKSMRHICPTEDLGIYWIVGHSRVEDMDLVIRIYGLHVVYDLRVVF
jgi:hypothetical protein